MRKADTVFLRVYMRFIIVIYMETAHNQLGITVQKFYIIQSIRLGVLCHRTHLAVKPT